MHGTKDDAITVFTNTVVPIESSVSMGDHVTFEWTFVTLADINEDEGEVEDIVRVVPEVEGCSGLQCQLSVQVRCCCCCRPFICTPADGIPTSNRIRARWLTGGPSIQPASSPLPREPSTNP